MSDQLIFEEEKKLSTGLNVLTILTFIWSAYELFTTFSSFTGGKEKLQEFDKAQEQMKDAPAWAQQFAGPDMRNMVQQMLDNKIPILIIGLISIGLCVFGAIEMRKQKKQGYYLWLTGELLPFLSMALFAPSFYSTFLKFFLIFPIIFIILYSVQLKNLRR